MCWRSCVSQPSCGDPGPGGTTDAGFSELTLGDGNRQMPVQPATGGPDMQKRYAATIGALAGAMVLTGLVSAQPANPRIGKWKLKQQPPALNIMTYEPAGGGGMKVTVESKNAQGREQKWTYTTMLDGKDVPIAGHPSADTCSVKRIDETTNEITNKKDGRVIQIITNVITPDGKTINNTYKNFNEKGEQTRTSTAVYERMP
jgi:hypothetical protein